MHSHAARLVALIGVVLVAACKDQSPISHAPNHLVIVSGSDQSGDVNAALAQPLVVQALDGANKSVAGVAIAWTVTGGGKLSSTSSTTDNDGKATVTWTLSPTAGTQIATATSAQITGASVAFVANNGATISGTVAPVVGGAGYFFGANFSRAASRSLSSNSVPRSPRRFTPDRIIVGFRDDRLGVAAAGSGAYRSMTVARTTASRIRERLADFAKSHAVSRVQVSPAILAARVRVADTTQLESIMAALRADPGVAYVERDEIISIRDGAPRPMSAKFARDASTSTGLASTNAAGRLPNDPFFWQQSWPSNMVDLPRAWSITTGNSSVIVASVDMGIRFDHPDIAANLTNDGYDFVSQVGFGTTESLCDGSTFTTIDGDGDGPDPDPTDPDDLEFDSFLNCWQHNFLGDHGLWTAGIIGAVGNDNNGLTGVNWSVKIRPIRVLGITGDGTNFDVAQGILYAAGLPAAGKDSLPVQAPSQAPIINVSLGGPGRSLTMQNAVNAVVAAGSLIVASAGNDGLDFESYPAAFNGVMGVAAVGMDGTLATYSNAGTFISVSAPGGDFRLDDNGGGGVLGPGWDFEEGGPTYLFGYGTSASAPYVSGVAALLLSQTPSLTAAQLKSRIEQFATRNAGSARNDTYGWGIVNAYNALTQQNGPARKTLARLVDATTGSLFRTVVVGDDGSFAFTRLPTGSFYLQAGDDEAGDALIGVPGRRFGWAGGFAKPTVFNINGDSRSIALAIGIPAESEPNDDVAHANFLTPGSYVVGTVTTPDVRDWYTVTIPAAGVYTFETSGVVGSCGLGVELDTFLTLLNSNGVTVSTNDNFNSATGRFCSRISANLQAGIYYVTVGAAVNSRFATHGRYRLEVRAGS
ncbi:MAG TPA: S8 family serine peptidase [Gemmatimonadaceae bacterium]|jgi:subtilisin family serine protease|nr:S8 family serine peptidase [Gemmatimonadaceae bacterium]